MAGGGRLFIQRTRVGKTTDEMGICGTTEEKHTLHFYPLTFTETHAPSGSRGWNNHKNVRNSSVHETARHVVAFSGRGQVATSVCRMNVPSSTKFRVTVKPRN